MPESSPPQIRYTARDFTLIKAELSAFIQTTRSDDWTDFFESNLGVALIELLAYVGDLLSFGQDALALEIFGATARRLESVLRFARTVGYVPRSAVSSETQLVSSSLPSNVIANGALIAAGEFVTGSNGLRYEVADDHIINPGDTTLTVLVNEGRTLTEAFEPARTANQEFTTSQGIVEEDSWRIYVGDPNEESNRWTQTPNVAFETLPTNTYSVEFDGEGKLHVFFGDDSAGKIPDQTVTVIYRTSNGAAGDTAVNTIRGALQAQVVGQNTTASIQVSNGLAAASGGIDRESVEELRSSIPAFLRTLDKLITILDYEEGIAVGVPVPLVFADVPLASFNGNVVRVHTWDTEQINFVSTSPISGLSSVTTYRRYVQIAAAKLHDIQRFLLPRTIVTVHNVIIRPTVSHVDLYLGDISYDRLRDIEAVHQDILDAVVGVFVSGTGFAVRISDLYDAVSSVPSVRHFTIVRVVWEHEDFDNPGLTIIEEFRTDQDVDGSEGGPFLPLQDLLVPGATRRKFFDDTYLFDNEVRFDGEIDSTVVQAINLRALVFEVTA